MEKIKIYTTSLLKAKSYRLKAEQGFTLIELALSVGIVAIIGAIIIIGVNRVQKTARDVARLSDIKFIQSALASYYSVNKLYPPTPTTAPCNSTALTTDGLGNSNCSVLSDASNGFTSTASSTGSIYMQPVPKNPQPNGYLGGYNYSRSADDKYSLKFQLEVGTGHVNIGCHTATPDSITPGC